MTPQQLSRRIKRLEKEMDDFARNLEFERAAAKRDEIRRVREMAMDLPEGLEAS
jgi:excinuclease ABC subunit B